MISYLLVSMPKRHSSPPYLSLSLSLSRLSRLSLSHLSLSHLSRRLGWRVCRLVVVLVELRRVRRVQRALS